jgi:hypothetical protein
MSPTTRAGLASAACGRMHAEWSGMTVFDNQVAVIVALRRKGRICAGAVGVPGVVVGRKLRARGISQVTTSGLWCSVWCRARPLGRQPDEPQADRTGAPSGQGRGMGAGLPPAAASGSSVTWTFRIAERAVMVSRPLDRARADQEERRPGRHHLRLFAQPRSERSVAQAGGRPIGIGPV